MSFLFSVVDSFAEEWAEPDLEIILTEWSVGTMWLVDLLPERRKRENIPFLRIDL